MMLYQLEKVEIQHNMKLVAHQNFSHNYLC